MTVTVVVRTGAEPIGVSVSFTFDAAVIVIGRGEGSDVRLPDPSVSHRHATIRQRGSEYIDADEGSTNGTFMGGATLGALAPRILRHGDLARVRRVWIELRFASQPPPAHTTRSTQELGLGAV